MQAHCYLQVLLDNNLLLETIDWKKIYNNFLYNNSSREKDSITNMIVEGECLSFG